MENFLNLQYFAEDAAAGAETAGTQTAEAAAEAPVQAGDSLPDGTKIGSTRVAAAMEKQMQRHPELRQVYGRGKPQADAPAAVQNTPAQQPDDIQARWEAAKKGEFAEMYGRDVQAAIQDRFKNQQNLQGELEMLEPALKVLRERAGVQNNQDLVHQIMDDDSLYEDAANEAGMTVGAYKEYLQFKQEHDEHVRAAEVQQFREGVERHFQKLAAEAQQLKERFPDIDIRQELQNPAFRRMTAPDVGMSVEDAYFAVHHKELVPQAMAYGMQRARSQMAQTVMANQNRPREGGLGSKQNAAADMKIDPRQMSRKERDALRAQIHAGKRITFD